MPQVMPLLSTKSRWPFKIILISNSMPKSDKLIQSLFWNGWPTFWRSAVKHPSEYAEEPLETCAWKTQMRNAWRQWVTFIEVPSQYCKVALSYLLPKTRGLSNSPATLQIVSSDTWAVRPMFLFILSSCTKHPQICCISAASWSLLKYFHVW